MLNECEASHERSPTVPLWDSSPHYGAQNDNNTIRLCYETLIYLYSIIF